MVVTLQIFCDLSGLQMFGTNPGASILAIVPYIAFSDMVSSNTHAGRGRLAEPYECRNHILSLPLFWCFVCRGGLRRFVKRVACVVGSVKLLDDILAVSLPFVYVVVVGITAWVSRGFVAKQLCCFLGRAWRLAHIRCVAALAP